MPELMKPLPCQASMSDEELLKLKHKFDDVYQSSTTPELFELCRAGSNLVDTVRAQRTALIVWQFQAAGAALALQRLIDAAQAMRDEQQAYEEYGSNEDSATEAEAVFDGLLADVRRALE